MGRVCSVIMALLAAVSLTAQQSGGLINFAHLDHLTESIDFKGGTVNIIHVYANAPDYRWTDAKESGPEGVACVDDAARAAVVYLRHYELTKTPASLAKARALLDFVRKMELENGFFYNFIHADHTMNTDGRTSFGSFGWWASRAVWSMANGFRIFLTIDPAYAAELKQGIERALVHVDTMVQSYPRTKKAELYTVPFWLLYGSAADASSELALGLTAYASATGDAKVQTYLRTICKGFIAMQDGDIRTAPYGMHRSWETQWHMWGNGQTQALASAGRLLGEKEFLASARLEAEGWYSRLLVNGFLKDMDLLDTSKRNEFEQIAYGVRPMAVGCVRLFEATGDSLFLDMAGLAASWLFGNNALNVAVYDPATGRGYDGLKSGTELNLNSGAESTIESLYTLVELERYPLACRWLQHKKVKTYDDGTVLRALYRADNAPSAALCIDRCSGTVRLLTGSAAETLNWSQDPL